MGDRKKRYPSFGIGESMPGTVGDSQGTHHDRQDGASFNPEDDIEIPLSKGERRAQHERRVERNRRQRQGKADSPNQSKQPPGKSKQSGKQQGRNRRDNRHMGEADGKRMRSAREYGDSWPADRQRRFLREHGVTAAEMGWTLTE